MTFARNNSLLKYLVIAAFSATFGSCSVNKLVVSNVVEAMEKGRVAFEREGDLDLAETALGSNLKLLEAILEQDPENQRLRLFLAEGYALYALAFVEDRFEELEYTDGELADQQRIRAIRFYDRAKTYASGEILKKMQTDSVDTVNEETLRNFLAKSKKEDARSLFWFAFSWGASVNLQRDEIIHLASLPYVEMIMNRVKELDEAYYFGGAYLFEGMYYGGRPPMLGGDMARSKAAFEKALVLSDHKILLIPYYFARTYCIQTQDLDCFTKNLDAVLNAPENLNPGQALANALAKRKARRLSNHKVDYFLEEE